METFRQYSHFCASRHRLGQLLGELTPSFSIQSFYFLLVIIFSFSAFTLSCSLTSWPAAVVHGCHKGDALQSCEPVMISVIVLAVYSVAVSLCLFYFVCMYACMCLYLYACLSAHLWAVLFHLFQLRLEGTMDTSSSLEKKTVKKNLKLNLKITIKYKFSSQYSTSIFHSNYSTATLYTASTITLIMTVRR